MKASFLQTENVLHSLKQFDPGVINWVEVQVEEEVDEVEEVEEGGLSSARPSLNHHALPGSPITPS